MTEKLSTPNFRLPLEILRMPLRNNTANDICQRLQEQGYNRGIRTVQRVLKELSEEGYLLVENSPQGNLYHSKNDIFAKTVNSAEAMLLQLAQKNLARLLPANLKGTMNDLFLQANEHQDKNPLTQQWLRKVSVVSNSLPQIPAPIDETVFEVVSEALYENRLLNLEYAKMSDAKQVYDLRPVGLIQQEYALYLIVFNKNNDTRTYAMHRIKKAEKTHLFEPIATFDLEQYAKEYRHNYYNGVKVRLTFRIPLDSGLHMIESKLSEDQTHELLEGSEEVRITATLNQSVQLTRWLNSFEGEMVIEAYEVLAPSVG